MGISECCVSVIYSELQTLENNNMDRAFFSARGLLTSEKKSVLLLVLFSSNTPPLISLIFTKVLQDFYLWIRDWSIPCTAFFIKNSYKKFYIGAPY